MNQQNIAVLDHADLIFIQGVVNAALDNGQTVSFTVEGGLKVKRGGSIWTLPFGKTLA